MTRDELSALLADFGKKVNLGQATTADFMKMKDHVRTTYDAGNLDKESMKKIGDTVSGRFKNMGRSPILEQLPGKVVEKGGFAGKLADIEKPVYGKVVSEAKNVGKKGLKSFGPLLGMLGAGAMAMGAGQKAMAGDIPGAAGDVADLATDYIPGVSQAKMALQSDEAGKGSDIVPAEAEQFDFSPYKTEKEDKPKKYPGLMSKLKG
jgi:hypothetical protein